MEFQWTSLLSLKSLVLSSVFMLAWLNQFHTHKVISLDIINYSLVKEEGNFSLVNIFFGGLECVGHLIAYVAHFVFLRDVWIRT